MFADQVLLALADFITCIGAGMTVKFFNLFFIQATLSFRLLLETSSVSDLRTVGFGNAMFGVNRRFGPVFYQSTQSSICVAEYVIVFFWGESVSPLEIVV